MTRLDREDPSPFEVLLIAESSEPVKATGGLRVLPDVTTDVCPLLDALVVPGGWGTRSAIKNQRLLEWIAARSLSRRHDRLYDRAPHEYRYRMDDNGRRV